MYIKLSDSIKEEIMKKITLFILGIFLLTSASLFAGDVQKIDPNAWLDHTSKMQVLRENIMTLVSKKMPTLSDKSELLSLQASFEAEQRNWQKYIKQVASNKNISTNTSQCKGTCPKCTCGKLKHYKSSHKWRKNSHKRRHHKGYKCANCDGKCKAKMCKSDCKCPKCSKMNQYKASKCANCDGKCKAKMC